MDVTVGCVGTVVFQNRDWDGVIDSAGNMD